MTVLAANYVDDELLMESDGLFFYYFRLSNFPATKSPTVKL